MLNMNHVTKHYDGFALDCTLSVRPGRITGLAGRNGAGKSTAFKSILGVIRPDGGSIEVFGKDVRRLTEKDRQRFGVALADSGFSSYLSLRDITHILKNMFDAFDSGWFAAQCRHFALPMDKKTKEFSTGMRTKLKLLIALSHKASLLILDEPTVGLDVVARDELLDLLRAYMEQDENRAVLISSHISSDIENLCDDIYLIHDGNILLHEETDVLLSDYALLKVTPQQFAQLDRQYIIRYKQEAYGYSCLTNQKQFYRENYPDIVLEKGSIDDLIITTNGGARI